MGRGGGVGGGGGGGGGRCAATVLWSCKQQDNLSADSGYDRTWKQCVLKMKNLVHKYKKVINNLTRRKRAQDTG